MRIAGIMENSIVDGPGIRVTVFVQGCDKACPGCHNEQTWDYAGGEEWSVDDLLKQVQLIAIENRITVSGGEPLDQCAEVSALLSALKEKGWDVWLYTGYVLENLNEEQRAVLAYVDVLVDGPFLLQQRSLSLKWRGSFNQRILYHGKDF